MYTFKNNTAADAWKWEKSEKDLAQRNKQTTHANGGRSKLVYTQLPLNIPSPRHFIIIITAARDITHPLHITPTKKNLSCTLYTRQKKKIERKTETLAAMTGPIKPLLRSEVDLKSNFAAWTRRRASEAAVSAAPWNQTRRTCRTIGSRDTWLRYPVLL